MSSLRGYFRSLDPQLPRSVWTMEAGGLANAFGNGITFPFLVIYLHNVRGLSLATAGLVLAAHSAVGLVASPVAGLLIDRFGGRVTLAASLVLMAIGYGLLPARRPAVAGVRARGGRRRRERRLLAEPVDAARGPDAAGAPPRGLRAPARVPQPRDRAGRD